MSRRTQRVGALTRLAVEDDTWDSLVQAIESADVPDDELDDAEFVVKGDGIYLHASVED